MANVNSVTMMGRVATDPEIGQGKKSKYARLRIAVERAWGPRDNRQTKTDFINIVVFGASAEYLERRGIAKGWTLFVQGSISTGSYEKEGRTIYTTDILGDQVDAWPPQSEPQRTPDDDIPF